jgi:carbamoyltransferase
MKYILGLNSGGYNTAAVLLQDGVPLFAVEEERLIRQKQTRYFPKNAIAACLEHAGIQMEDVEAVVINWNPAINIEALNVPQTLRMRYMGEIFYAIPSNLMALRADNASSTSEQRIRFLDESELNVQYINHHQTHAAAYFCSPFDEAAVLTMDAFGERHSTSFARGIGNKLDIFYSLDFPQSVGSFYSVYTEYLGFRSSSEEWKLMGASSYGDPDRFYAKIRSTVTLRDDGGYGLDLSLYDHHQFQRSAFFTEDLVKLLGVEPHSGSGPLSKDYYDIAAGAQKVTEEIIFHLANHLHRQTGMKNLVVSGGVAMNCVVNGKILANTPFENIFISPVPDDSGGALGGALYYYHHVLGHPRKYRMTDNYLGPGYASEEIKATLEKYKINYETVTDPAQKAAELIAGGSIIGWFQGRLEYGDRALGNRSILADPRDASMKDKVNATIKYREKFRPFAPSVMEEHFQDYFVDALPTPYMEKVFQIPPKWHKHIPAVTHADGSGRLQTVSKEQNSDYWNLINAFNTLTGVPIVLNTSFNLKGEPVVCSPTDAIRTFFSSGLDALVMGRYIVLKNR